MPSYSFETPSPQRKWFGRQRQLHAFFGGGKVADLLLWKDKLLSSVILFGFSVIWYLFQVLEYHFVTLLCHIAIASMLILFIWHSAAGFITWSPPNLKHLIITEPTCRYCLESVRWLVFKFYHISSGKDLTQFFVTITSLWIFSIIGNYLSTLNLLYFAFLCLEILPILYERYELEVDYLASKGSEDAKLLMQKFDSKVLQKIPRGPVKGKKFK